VPLCDDEFDFGLVSGLIALSTLGIWNRGTLSAASANDNFEIIFINLGLNGHYKVAISLLSFAWFCLVAYMYISSRLLTYLAKFTTSLSAFCMEEEENGEQKTEMNGNKTSGVVCVSQWTYRAKESVESSKVNFLFNKIL